MSQVHPSRSTALPGRWAEAVTSLAERFPDLDRDIAHVLDRPVDLPAPGADETALETSRAAVRRGNVNALPGPSVDLVRDSEIGSVPVREYRKAGEPASLLVYLHGGGWVTGDLDYSDAVCRAVAVRSGGMVVNVGYRLAPEAVYPAALDDATAVVRALSGQYQSQRLVVMGDSAGANLAAALAARSVLDGGVRIDGQVLVYPLLDDDLARDSYQRNEGIVLSRAKMRGFLDAYCPDVERRADEDFAPLKAGSMRGLPETVVVVAGHDPLHDEGVEYARRLALDAVPVELVELPSLTHGFLRQTANSAAAERAAAKVIARAVELLADRW